MDEYCKRSGQIPAFGNWEYANELPITQYFECARQAGLIRYSSSSGDSNPCIRGDNLYTVDRPLKPSNRIVAPPGRKTRMREKRLPNVKEQKRQTGKLGKVRDVMEPPLKQGQQHPQDAAVLKSHRLPTRPPKPVDEDLYKIPPELLHTTKKKKALGIFSRCLVPACTS